MTDDAASPRLSFILLEDTNTPDANAIVAAAAEMKISLSISKPVDSKDKADAGPEILSFDLADEASLFVMMMPVPHPDASEMPFGPLSPEDQDALANAPAHCIVTSMGLEGTVDEIDIKMSALTACVLAGCNALGVMKMPGVLFHRPELFANVAREGIEQNELPFLICVDITVAQESETHMSFLTHNMQRYDREEFYIIASSESSGALDYLLDIMAWMLGDREYHLPTGDTIGRTEDEKIVVQRVANPTGEGPKVIKLELPD